MTRGNDTTESDDRVQGAVFGEYDAEARQRELEKAFPECAGCRYYGGMDLHPTVGGPICTYGGIGRCPCETKSEGDDES